MKNKKRMLKTTHHTFFSRMSLLLLPLFFPLFLFAQHSQDFFSYPNDTIITQKSWLKKKYFLRGRALNLSVMKWVMQEVPEAKSYIQKASLSDELSIAAYGFGGGACFLGLIIVQNNKSLGFELLKYGGATIGGGFVFQLLSANYVEKAVLNFNLALKKKSITPNFQVNLKVYPNRVGFGVQF